MRGHGFVGELFSRKKFPRTPSKKHSHEYHKIELLVCGQTVDASHKDLLWLPQAARDH